jgi:two-component system OmpR family response regulator
MALICVLDDEPTLLDLISTTLRSDGHKVLAVANPNAACDAIIGAQPSVDLLITEAQIKPISGFELVKRLRSKGIECPVIFTSHHHGIAAVLTESLGRRSVIEKPFSAAELRSVVRKSLVTGKRNAAGQKESGSV